MATRAPCSAISANKYARPERKACNSMTQVWAKTSPNCRRQRRATAGKDEMPVKAAKASAAQARTRSHQMSNDNEPAWCLGFLAAALVAAATASSVDATLSPHILASADPRVPKVSRDASGPQPHITRAGGHAAWRNMSAPLPPHTDSGRGCKTCLCEALAPTRRVARTTIRMPLPRRGAPRRRSYAKR